MNWLLPVTIVLILASAWDGHRKGLIRKSVGIVSLGLTLFFTTNVTPYIAGFLKDNTGMYSLIQKGISGSDAELIETMEILGLGDAVSGYMADQVLQVLAFLITLVLVWVLVRGIAFALGIASMLPVLHGLNKLAGFFLGLFEGVLLVWIIFFVITVCSSTEWGGTMLKMIAQSNILTWLYRNNILFALL